MGKYWKAPYYKLIDSSGEQIIIDVTSSVSGGLPPNKLLLQKIIPELRQNDINTVLDFGAGALRHTLLLLKQGFEVTAVEFKEQFERPSCKQALQKASRYRNFRRLVWPSQFIKHKRKYGAVLLSYVLQVMPIPAERDLALKHIVRKLKPDACLFYLSRFNQWDGISEDHCVSDGYVKGLKYKFQSFYTEFPTSDTHRLMEKFGLERIRSISERGTDQAFVYGRGGFTWI